MAHNGRGKSYCGCFVRQHKVHPVHIGGGLSARCARNGVYTELEAQSDPPPATSNLVLNAGEPSFYFYVSNGCNEESNAPPVYFEVEVSLYEPSSIQLSAHLFLLHQPDCHGHPLQITERAYRGSATRGKRCQEGVVVSPWPAIARIWLWWLGVPVLCFCGMTAVMVACLCMAPRMGIKIPSATVAPTSQQKAGEDSSAPDVEMGALKAEEDDSENDPEKPPDKPATAVS